MAKKGTRQSTADKGENAAEDRDNSMKVVSDNVYPR